ncbi:hypothetical protein E3N88_25831 [Mikania micrantha]|uniref:Uncharacterized protein n=1 Tax=Mikania micrantha TaxID=192012 RepID=A0A5N6N6S5_9ASTR|nr:hypothetical protein E3N88_25831 [Mikania micrantha]
MESQKASNEQWRIERTISRKIPGREIPTNYRGNLQRVNSISPATVEEEEGGTTNVNVEEDDGGNLVGDRNPNQGRNDTF